MHDTEIKSKLSQVSCLDEVKNLLIDSPEVDAKRVWREIENRRSNKEECLT